MSTKTYGQDLTDFRGKDPSPRGDLMSLSDGVKGTKYRVIQMVGGEEISRRLIPFGIFKGSKLKLLGNQTFGGVMIEKGQDEIALSREIAQKIKVEPWRKRKRNRFGRQSN